MILLFTSAGEKYGFLINYSNIKVFIKKIFYLLLKGIDLPLTFFL